MNDRQKDETRGYRSEALRSIHSAAEDLRAVGAIDDATMRKFDAICLGDAMESTAATGGRSLLEAIADHRDVADFDFDPPPI